MDGLVSRIEEGEIEMKGKFKTKPCTMAKFSNPVHLRPKTILEALTGEEEEFYISNSERIMLVDMLAFVSVSLRTGKFFFNKPGKENNRQYAEFAEEMARRLASMPVHEEN